MTVELCSTPRRMIGKVVAPSSVHRMRTITFPFAGTVKLARRLVVSKAVIARSEEVALDTAAAGS